jgi:hypothetical protein
VLKLKDAKNKVVCHGRRKGKEQVQGIKDVANVKEVYVEVPLLKNIPPFKDFIEEITPPKPL